MPLPGNGPLSLQGHSLPGETTPSKPKIAMIVRMSAETLEALEAYPHQPTMDFEFGPNPGIHIGETFFPVRSLKEGTAHELYLRTTSAAKPMAPLKLYANVIGKFTVERELGEKIQDKVRDRTIEAEKQRTGRMTKMLDTPPDLVLNGKKRKPPGSSMFRKPVQTDPARNLNVPSLSSTPRVPSPHPQPTPTPSSPLKQEGLVPLRRRLVRCLANSPRTTEEIRKLFGAAADPNQQRDVLALLEEVAEQQDKSPQTWKLKTRTWLEVRPYEWPKLTEPERTAMARSAKLAYKELNIPESDPVWAHVRHRATANVGSAPQFAAPQRANASQGAANSTRQGSGSPLPKHLVSSSKEKEKKAKASARLGDVSVHSGSGTPGRDLEDGEVASPGPSISKPARRTPGSGFKAKALSHEPNPEPRAVAESPTVRKANGPVDPRNKLVSLPPTPALAVATPVPEKKGGTSALISSQRILKKTRDSPVVESDRERDRERQRARQKREGEREKDNVREVVKDRQNERVKVRDIDRERERDGDHNREREKSGNREKERETDRDGDVGRVRGRERAVERDRDREQDKEKTDAAPNGLKRKKRPQDQDYDDEPLAKSSASAPKRRKMDDAIPHSTKEQQQQRARDLSLPKKPEALPLPLKMKKEVSPLPPRPKQLKREASPLRRTRSPPPRPKAKKDSPIIAPTPRPQTIQEKASSHSNTSSTSSFGISHAPERAASSKPSHQQKSRRRSPIYTSSEDEGEVRKPTRREAGASLPAQQRPRQQQNRRRDSAPLPSDLAGLRIRYRSSYAGYIRNFSKMIMQKTKIEQLLEEGAAQSITDSDGDVELMDLEELTALTQEHTHWERELEAIRRTYDRLLTKSGSPSD